MHWPTRGSRWSRSSVAPGATRPPIYPPTYAADELRYRIRHELFPQARADTYVPQLDGQTALPIRPWGSFMPPNGVGGGGVHWNAETWRFLPTDFRLRSHLVERYGQNFCPTT